MQYNHIENTAKDSRLESLPPFTRWVTWDWHFHCFNDTHSTCIEGSMYLFIDSFAEKPSHSFAKKKKNSTSLHFVDLLKSKRIVFKQLSNTHSNQKKRNKNFTKSSDRNRGCHESLTRGVTQENKGSHLRWKRMASTHLLPFLSFFFIWLRVFDLKLLCFSPSHLSFRVLEVGWEFRLWIREEGSLVYFTHFISLFTFFFEEQNLQEVSQDNRRQYTIRGRNHISCICVVRYTMCCVCNFASNTVDQTCLLLTQGDFVWDFASSWMISCRTKTCSSKLKTKRLCSTTSVTWELKKPSDVDLTTVSQDVPQDPSRLSVIIREVSVISSSSLLILQTNRRSQRNLRQPFKLQYTDETRLYSRKDRWETKLPQRQELVTFLTNVSRVKKFLKENRMCVSQCHLSCNHFWEAFSLGFSFINNNNVIVSLKSLEVSSASVVLQSKRPARLPSKQTTHLFETTVYSIQFPFPFITCKTKCCFNDTKFSKNRRQQHLLMPWISLYDIPYT